jgi:hypothetical protein
MNRFAVRFISLFLVLPLGIMGIAPATAAFAMTKETTTPIFSDTMSGERTNVVFLEGEPGDTHLIYTYEQDDMSYKVEENTTADFRNVSSVIYILDSDGCYVEDSTVEVSVNSDEDMIIALERADETVEVYTISADSASIGAQSIQSQSAASDPGYDWITEYYNGSTHLTNFTITVILAEIGYLASYLNPVAGAIVTGVAAVANVIFNMNAEWVYFHKIYNWRHSARNYFVIEEAQTTQFYTDSGHNNYIGYTYSEWRDN